MSGRNDYSKRVLYARWGSWGTNWYIRHNKDSKYTAQPFDTYLKENSDDYVEVWVGHGIYEDYKGFVMRNKAPVLGGFPTDIIAAPGLSERHALVSTEVPLSKQNANLDGEQDQYETILQIQDKEQQLTKKT